MSRLLTPAFPVFAACMALCVGSTFAARAQTPTPKGAAASLALVPVLIRESLQAADAVTDPSGKVTVLCAIGEARAHAGNLSGAKQSLALAWQTTDKIADTEPRSDALRQIAVMQAKVKDTAGAKETFEAARQGAEQAKDDQEKVRILANVAADEQIAGFAEAKATFQKAKQAADGITNPIPHTFSLCHIAGSQMRSGDKAGAKATALEAEQLSGQIPDRYWKDRVRGLEVVGTLALTGSLDAARSLTEEIADAYMKSCGYQGIATVEARGKDLTAASQTAAKVTDTYIKARTLLSM